MNLIHLAQGDQLMACYVIQQIQQFRAAGEEFWMQHKDMELRDDVESQLLREILANAHRIEGLSKEEIEKSPLLQQVLADATAEQRLKGLSMNELVESLAAEKRAELQALLSEQESGSDESE